MRRASPFLLLWAPVVLYMGLIFVLSSISQPPALLDRVTDKGAHAALYFGLGALLVRALAGGWSRVVTLHTTIAAVAIAGLCGISDEVHQSFVPARQAEALDVIADLVGASLSAGALHAHARSAEVKRKRARMAEAKRRRGV